MCLGYRTKIKLQLVFLMFLMFLMFVVIVVFLVVFFFISHDYLVFCV